MARGSSEEFKLQAKCAQWLWNEHPETRRCFILIDNNSDNVVQALQKKAMGQVKGAADTFFVWKGGIWFLEFKTPTGKQSEFQELFEVAVRRQLCHYIIIKHFDQFKGLLESILGPKN